MHIEGEPNPLGITPGHIIWSADREEWVHVQHLREGERLLAINGATPRIECLALCSKPEPVYNIEVDGDHCYRVGEQGLLVHNASVNPLEWIRSATAPSATIFSRYAMPAADYRKNWRNTRRPRTSDLSEGYKTLGLLRYRDPAGTEHVLMPSGYPFAISSISGTGHAERQLIDLFNNLPAPPSGCLQIVEIFAERDPCDRGWGCALMIQMAAQSQTINITVYSIAQHGADDSEECARVLRAAYSKLGLYNDATGWR